MFCLRSRLSLRRCRGDFLGARLALRFYWSVLLRFTPAVCRMATNRTACGSVAGFCLRSCRGLRFCRDAALARARHRVSVAASSSVRARSLHSCRGVALGTRLALRFWRGGLPSFTPGLAVLLRCFAFVHACLFSFVRKKETACDALRFYSAGRDRLRAFSRRSSVICLGGFTSGLCVYLWRSRRVTGDARNERTGLRGWRCGLCALLCSRIGLAVLSAGSTLGLRAPDCAKESSTLWTLFTLRRGCVGACSRPLCVFA